MFNRNNLDKSSSPYLLQHRDNPIHWQEYSKEVVNFAKNEDKPILLSIGYSTCHWCHVMAADTFSDEAIADYMNSNYVCIKVDREQRPDIDSFCMSFMQEAYGQGGWPLNVVVTPDLKPFFAATYIASTPKHSMPGFLEIAQRVLAYYEDNKNDIDIYKPQNFKTPEIESPDLLNYVKQFDAVDFGFIANQKFPPHCTLLYLLSNPHISQYEEIKGFLKNTLDKMQDSGLHDQIGGGFFRYCVDKEWKIPHFEKMLYDQAMMLITYSLGYYLFKDESYKETIKQILFSLDDTFNKNGLYMSGHDADTEHEEGTTYLWNEDEFPTLAKYNPVAFENKFHINSRIEEDTRRELYEIRKSRPQPSVDTKTITSWNCLLGVGFFYVEKFVGMKTQLQTLFANVQMQKRTHTSNNDELQKEYFLEDAASFLLLETFMYELQAVTFEELNLQYEEVMQFKVEGKWIENPNSDFLSVEAQKFDHPIPSSVSLLEWALTRFKILSDQETLDIDYSLPLNFDAHNFVALLERESKFYKCETEPKEKSPLSLFKKDKENVVCYKDACTPYISSE